MTEVAFDEIIGSERYSIARFVERFDRALDEHGAPRARRHHQVRYRAARLERVPRLGPSAPPGAPAASAASSSAAGVKVALALGLVARVPALRRLLGLYVIDLVVRRSGRRLAGRVLEDLLKLALLQRLRTGTPPVRIAVGSGDGRRRADRALATRPTAAPATGSRPPRPQESASRDLGPLGDRLVDPLAVAARRERHCRARRRARSVGSRVRDASRAGGALPRATADALARPWPAAARPPRSSCRHGARCTSR